MKSKRDNTIYMGRMMIGILVLSVFVSTAIAGIPGLIESKDANKNVNSEQSIWELDPNSDVRVIITLKDVVTDEKVKGLKNKIGDFKETSKRWSKVYPNGFAATIKKKQFEQLLEDTSIERIDIDKKFYTQIDTANYWSGVTKAREEPPTGYNVTGDRNGLPHSYTKDDVVIAILDTGIDPKHVDLTGSDNGGTEKVIGWADVIYGSLSPYDDNGHGTAVASIAAGEGDSDPNYKGVAPGAALVGVKVLYSDWGYESDIVTGINWVVDTKGTYGTKIMSLSLNSAGSSDGKDPISVALNNAVNNGIVVVVSSGNTGPQKYTIGSPGAASQAITVGAIADVGYLLQALPGPLDYIIGPKPPKPKNNLGIESEQMPLRDNGFYLAPFSARGPTADNKIKPDIVAPGVAIMSAQYTRGSDYHGGYIEYTGTSMAAPFVSGVAALMLDANYVLNPDQIKNIIRNTGEDYGVTSCDIDYGCGRIRAYKAIGNASTGNTPADDQWVPTHLRYSLQMNDITLLKKYSVSITDNNYPIASTLIMRDWSGTIPGINLGMFLNDPLGNQIAYVNDWWYMPRQETFSVKTDYKGIYNLSIFKAQTGSGYYVLDISKR